MTILLVIAGILLVAWLLKILNVGADKPTIKPIDADRYVKPAVFNEANPIKPISLPEKPKAQVTEIPFQQWAFGAQGYDAPNLFKAWNERHGNYYRLYEDDEIKADLAVMNKLYDKAMRGAKKCPEIKIMSPIKPEVKLVDKKMHKITNKINEASKDIKKHMPSKAQNVLKAASRANEKLVKIDREVRDPLIKKEKKLEKKVKKMGK